MLKWSTTKKDALLIAQIVKRAAKLSKRLCVKCEPLGISMDIYACHANGCPLKLRELLDADDGNFSHDVGGISRHIDRETGQLTDCFVPRFAV